VDCMRLRRMMGKGVDVVVSMHDVNESIPLTEETERQSRP
jgi:hypothetical protein